MEMGIIYASIIILIGLAGAVVIHLIVSWLKKKADATESRLDDILIQSLGKPLVVLVFAVSVYIALRFYAVIPAPFDLVLNANVINAFYIIIGAWITSTFFHNFILTYGRWLSAKTKGDLDDRFINLLEIIAKYIIWFAAFLLILYVFGVDITPFLAGAGIAGLALALAAQDILGNFFGGAIITMDKPFKLGDRIQIDKYVGDVVAVGPRSTRIRTLDYQLVTIPNSKITSNIIVNIAMPDQKLKVRFTIPVAYGTDVKKVKDILLSVVKDATENTPYIALDPPPEVHFSEFGDSSLNFTFFVWIKDYTKTWDARDAINTRINERFRDAGIEIPYKQIDVRMRS